MSKMTKLLNKAQETRDVARHITRINHQESLEQLNNDQNVFTEKFIPKTSQGLMFMILFVAIASLAVSYKAVIEINESRKTTQSLLTLIQSQSVSVANLESKLNKQTALTTQSDISITNEIQSLTSALDSNKTLINKSRQQAEDLSLKYRELIETTKDVHATNKLLLQKYINLNQEVQELKKMKILTSPQITVSEAN